MPALALVLLRYLPVMGESRVATFPRTFLVLPFLNLWA
jgi:hypothetical protein